MFFFLRRSKMKYKFRTINPKDYEITLSYTEKSKTMWDLWLKMVRKVNKTKLPAVMPEFIVLPSQLLPPFKYFLKAGIKDIHDNIKKNSGIVCAKHFDILGASMNKEKKEGYTIIIQVTGEYKRVV